MGLPNGAFGINLAWWATEGRGSGCHAQKQDGRRDRATPRTKKLHLSQILKFDVNDASSL